MIFGFEAERNTGDFREKQLGRKICELGIEFISIFYPIVKV